MPQNRRSSRRLSRERAFQVLFGLSFTPPEIRATPSRALALAPFAVSGDLPEKALDFARELVEGVWEHREAIDKAIGGFSQHWKLTRIARVELAILRLAMFEMLHRPDIPLKVTINEAVELAKIYGDDNSRNFVNGILDAAAKAVTSGALGAVRTTT